MWTPGDSQSYKVGSGHSSVRLSVQVFSWNCIISFFQNFGMMLGTHMKLCTTAGFSRKNFFATKMGQKQGFLNVLKKFAINFYWICSIMKIYIICCVPAQIPYQGKFWFQRYGPKCSQPIRFQDFLINISLEQINEIARFFMLTQIYIN